MKKLNRQEAKDYFDYYIKNHKKKTLMHPIDKIFDFIEDDDNTEFKIIIRKKDRDYLFKQKVYKNIKTFKRFAPEMYKRYHNKKHYGGNLETYAQCYKHIANEWIEIKCCDYL